MLLPTDASIQQVVNSTVGCGLASESFKVEVIGGGEVFVFVKARNASDRTLACLNASERREPYPTFIFKAEQASRKYQKIQDSASRQEARSWLGDRGKLDDLPEFNPATENLDQFARRLDVFCGFEAGEVLKAARPNLLTTQRSWYEKSLAGNVSDAEKQGFECLVKSIAASNLGLQGIAFGFIANEATEVR